MQASLAQHRQLAKGDPKFVQPGHDVVGTKPGRSWFKIGAKGFCNWCRIGTQFMALVRNRQGIQGCGIQSVSDSMQYPGINMIPKVFTKGHIT